jgi:predicted transcriptional regulator
MTDIEREFARLGILAITHEARQVELGYLRDRLDLTAGILSDHVGALTAAGLVAVGKRGHAWLNRTAAGDAALSAEIRRLKQLIARVEKTS